MRTKRRFNYTGRKTINRDAVEIRMQESPGGKPPEFSAAFNFAKLNLPEKGKIIVEAYHKSTAQRFSFGRVGEMKEPESTALTEVDLGGRVLFRVKVVDDSEKFDRLLASAEQISPVDDGDDANRDYLIKVVARDLVGRVWALDLNEDPHTKPELHLNYRIPDSINQVRHNPLFQGLVLPAAVREIYRFIFWDCENDAEEGSWQQMWLDFGEGISGREPPGATADSTEFHDWTDEILGIFSERHGLCDRVVAALTEDK